MNTPNNHATALIDRAKRYLATSKPHWPLDQMSNDDLLQIGKRIAALGTRADFGEVLFARNARRHCRAIGRPTIGEWMFKRFDPQNPPQNLIRRHNLRRGPKELAQGKFR